MRNDKVMSPKVCYGRKADDLPGQENLGSDDFVAGDHFCSSNQLFVLLMSFIWPTALFQSDFSTNYIHRAGFSAQFIDFGPNAYLARLCRYIG